MENRIAVIGIIVDEPDSVESLNKILHNYSDIIIGRLGLPYKEKAINIISFAVDASEAEIAELTEQIGQLDGVSSNTAISNK